MTTAVLLSSPEHSALLDCETRIERAEIGRILPVTNASQANELANVRAVRDAYDDWREKSSRLMTGLTQGLSIRETCEAAQPPTP